MVITFPAMKYLFVQQGKKIGLAFKAVVCTSERSERGQTAFK